MGGVGGLREGVGVAGVRVGTASVEDLKYGGIPLRGLLQNPTSRRYRARMVLAHVSGHGEGGPLFSRMKVTAASKRPICQLTPTPPLQDKTSRWVRRTKIYQK